MVDHIISKIILNFNHIFSYGDRSEGPCTELVLIAETVRVMPRTLAKVFLARL